MQHRPTLLSSCAKAATAAEARFRINRPNSSARASRIVALDEHAAALVRRAAEQRWSGARFLVYEAPAAVNGDGLPVDATLRAHDGSEALLSHELDGADVAVMVVSAADGGAEPASVIGRACAERGIMTAGLVVSDGSKVHDAVSALRPYAMVLVIAEDEDDIPHMLTALRA